VKAAIGTLASLHAKAPLALKLNTVNACRKFSGILEIIAAVLVSEHVVIMLGVITALRGMFVHRSQNLWYRQIFVCVSSYSYVNSFSTIS
jgi:hypothetical protein